MGRRTGEENVENKEERRHKKKSRGRRDNESYPWFFPQWKQASHICHHAICLIYSLFSNALHLLFPQWQPRKGWTLILAPSLTLQCSNHAPAPPSPPPKSSEWISWQRAYMKNGKRKIVSKTIFLDFFQIVHEYMNKNHLLDLCDLSTLEFCIIKPLF